MSRNGAPEDHPTPAQTEEVSVRPADSRTELERTYQLVYHTYLERDYISPNPSGLRVSFFNAFPDTITFVGTLRDDVVATVTLVPETPIGLPMDEIYHDELQALRDQGRHIAEVTMLADRRHELRRTVPMLLELMKRLFDYATLAQRCNDLCITVNPRHGQFYKRFLLFESLAGLRQYPSVSNNPALALRLNLDHVREACEGNERLLHNFFEHRSPISIFTNRYRMTQEDFEHFFVKKTSCFHEAPRQVIECLRNYYPSCPWDRWAPPKGAGFSRSS